MSYANHRRDFAPYLDPREARVLPAAKGGLWRRLVDAVMASRQRMLDRQIAHFLETRGGQLTDDVERELMRHLTASAHYWNG